MENVRVDHHTSSVLCRIRVTNAYGAGSGSAFCQLNVAAVVMNAMET